MQRLRGAVPRMQRVWGAQPSEVWRQVGRRVPGLLCPPRRFIKDACALSSLQIGGGLRSARVLAKIRVRFQGKIRFSFSCLDTSAFSWQATGDYYSSGRHLLAERGT